jgi:hypothetical protein
MLLQESFVHGSPENLAKPSDEAAIREAILPLVCLPMLGSQPPLIQIRWLSSTIVVAMVSAPHCWTYYCVVQNEQGKWEASASLPKWYILPLKDWPPLDRSASAFPPHEQFAQLSCCTGRRDFTQPIQRTLLARRQ